MKLGSSVMDRLMQDLRSHIKEFGLYLDGKGHSGKLQTGLGRLVSLVMG